MITETQPITDVKPAQITEARKRVSAIKLGDVELIAPAEVSTEQLLHVTEILANCRALIDTYDSANHRYVWSVGEPVDVSLSIGMRLMREEAAK